jgi:hypothetical protein
VEDVEAINALEPENLSPERPGLPGRDISEAWRACSSLPNSGAAAADKSIVARRIPTLLDNIKCHDSGEELVRDEYLRYSTL